MANEKYIRKVVKNGRKSYYINIPKEIVRKRGPLGLQAVERVKRKLLLRIGLNQLTINT